MIEYPDTYGTTNDVTWRPDSRYVVIDSAHGAFVFDVFTRKNVRLTDVPPYNPPSWETPHALWYAQWDDARHQVILSQVNGDVVAFHLDTGAMAGYFHDPDTYGWREIAYSPDNTRLVIFTGSAHTYLAVWDRDTLTETRLDSGYGPSGFAETTAMSSDNRYLVIASSYHICIWDLWNLPAKPQDRTPSCSVTSIRLPLSARFVNETAVEVVTNQGNTETWDIHTGKPVSSS